MEGKELSVSSEQTAGQQSPPSITLSAVLSALKDNFALVSTASLLISVSLATIFLSAYLSVFGWHLMWFVQYTDIITFGLLALGVLSGSVTLLQSLAQAVLAGRTPQQRRSGLIVIVLLGVTGMALGVWDAIHKGEGFFHVVYAALTLSLAVTLVVIVAKQVEARELPTAGQCFAVLLLLVIFAGCLGQWLGQVVKETSAFNQDIALKDKDQTLTNAKLIIVMSRHTVLAKDDALYVLPTSDITKFQRAAKFAKLK
jgi:hypothetical protein